MRRVLRVLACCAVLACGPLLAEEPGTTPGPVVDFSSPLPGGMFYIKCGPVEGLGMRRLDVAPRFTAGGKYVFYTASDAVFVEYESSGTEHFLMDTPREGGRVNLNTAKWRNDSVNTNFMVAGLKDDCALIFAARNIRILDTLSTIENARYLHWSDMLVYTLSSKIDQVIAALLAANGLQFMVENIVILDIEYQTDHAGVPIASVALMDGYVLSGAALTIVK
jgi:hypothetical protein